MITFEQFNEEFLELMMDERLSIYNRYCEEYDIEDKIEDNEDYNLEEYFDTKLDAIRAALYGDYRVTDEYFKIDGRGNLESFCDLDAMEHINDKLDDIYEHPEFWKEYIDPDGDDDEEEGGEE